MENFNSSSSPSPQRPNSAYLRKIKRKRGSISCAGDLSDSETNNTEITEHPPSLLSSRHKRTLSSMPPPLSKGPKRVEVPLPGPSPKKRARNSADPQDKARNLSGKTSIHERTSSISSMDCQEDDSLGKGVKPISLVGAKTAKTGPLKQLVTSDVEEDDNVSIAESSKGSIILRRTEPERLQFFTEHPECGNIEPHRALCSKCDKWVNLGRRQTYTVRPWEKHRERCDKLARATQSPRAVQLPEGEIDEDDDDAASTVALSVSQPERLRRTESERQALLESDPRAEVVKPTEVLCRKCQKWIKLSNKSRFALTSWNGHQQRCSGDIPSSRIATAERKLRIVNDAQAKTFTTRSVECAACETNVLLEGDGDYDLTKWEEHKGHCSSVSQSSCPVPNHELAVTVPGNRSPETSSSTPNVRPSPSSASTDSTLVASDTTRPGLKRAGEPADEGRPHKRPRTGNNEKEVGPLSWLFLPFKTFVRGFREGLQS